MPVAPKKYTKTLNVKITPLQHETLEKLKSRNVKVSNFVREAIREKINREAKELRPKPEKEYCPF